MPSAAQTRAIHALRKQIAGFDDASYRGLLRERFRVVSSTALTDGQALVLIDELKGLAGQPVTRSAATTATGRYAPVLQALWLSAHALCLVDKRDDKAMLAFVARQTGLSHTRFLTDAADARRAIEALKKMLERGGVVWPKGDDLVLRKRAVLDAVARRQKEVLPSFRLDDWLLFANLPRLQALDGRGLDRAIAKLGAQLRQHLGARGK
jgi:hypothetical protein